MGELNFLAPIEANIPKELKELSQWVVWKGEVIKNEKTGKERASKIPYNAGTGGKAKTNAPETWSDFKPAWETYRKGDFDGVGFVPAEDDPFVGWDLDDCRNPGTGAIDDESLKIINRLASYTEVSPSGKGVRIFVKAELPPGGRKKGKIEVYESGQYLTLTGHRLPETSPAIEERRMEVESLHKEIFGSKKETRLNAPLSDKNKGHSVENQGLAHQDILRKAFDSKNGAKIRSLYNGDISSYPSQSEADQALCNHLAYFSNGSFEAVDGFFRTSGLYREKWDEKHYSDGRTYGQATIKKALDFVNASCSANKKAGNENKDNTFKPQIISAYELGKMDFPEPKWAVPGILHEGLNLLGGKPKQGKSMLALNLCLSIAAGSKALGKLDVEEGSVLYLSLEDNLKLIQERLLDMSEEAKLPKKFYLSDIWPRMDKGGMSFLKEEVKRIPNLRLVVIDTLAAFKPAQSGRNISLYDTDYSNISKIREIATHYEVSVLVIHHLRKLGSDDIMETFSGTLGLSGAADNLLVLEKGGINTDTILHVKGRRIENQEIALSFDADILSWQYLGKSEDIKSTDKIQKVYDALKEAQEPLGPKKLVELTGFGASYIDKTLKKLIKNGDAKKISRGKYIFNRIQSKEDGEGQIGQNGQKDSVSVDSSPTGILEAESEQDEKSNHNNELDGNLPIQPNLPNLLPNMEADFDHACPPPPLWINCVGMETT